MDNETIARQNAALNILVDAAKLAQSRGVFTLEQASLVNEAIKVFRAEEPPAEAPPVEGPAV
jgi:hypothetical protein